MAAPTGLDLARPPRPENWRDILAGLPGQGGLPALPELPPFTPRGPFGVTPNVGRFTRPNWSWIDRFSERTPQETASLQSVSDIARLITGQGSGLYDVGAPAYSQAINYYRRLLGGSREAITEAVAPQGQAIADIYKGAERSLKAGPLRGGARELASGELSREKTGAIAGLPAQAREAAAAAAGGLGLAGAQAGVGAEQAGAGLYGNIAEMEQANRFGGIGAAQAQQGLGLQAALGAARLTLDDLVQSGQLGLEEYRIMTGNNLALGRLTLDQYLGEQNLNLRQRELAMRERDGRDAKTAAKWRLVGQIVGGVAGFFIGGPPGAMAGYGLGGAAVDAFGSGGGSADSSPSFDWPEYAPAGSDPGRT